MVLSVVVTLIAEQPGLLHLCLWRCLVERRSPWQPNDDEDNRAVLVPIPPAAFLLIPSAQVNVFLKKDFIFTRVNVRRSYERFNLTVTLDIYKRMSNYWFRSFFLFFSDFKLQ